MSRAEEIKAAVGLSSQTGKEAREAASTAAQEADSSVSHLVAACYLIVSAISELNKVSERGTTGGLRLAIVTAENRCEQMHEGLQRVFEGSQNTTARNALVHLAAAIEDANAMGEAANRLVSGIEEHARTLDETARGIGSLLGKELTGSVDESTGIIGAAEELQKHVLGGASAAEGYAASL